MHSALSADDVLTYQLGALRHHGEGEGQHCGRRRRSSATGSIHKAPSAIETPLGHLKYYVLLRFSAAPSGGFIQLNISIFFWGVRHGNDLAIDSHPWSCGTTV
eukprot:scaffold20738_cov113-Isochrysis_galbana.AAC.1